MGSFSGWSSFRSARQAPPRCAVGGGATLRAKARRAAYLVDGAGHPRQSPAAVKPGGKGRVRRVTAETARSMSPRAAVTCEIA